MKRLPPPWGIRRNRNLPQGTEKYEKDAADICSGVFCIYIHNVAVCIKMRNKQYFAARKQIRDAARLF